MDDDEYAQGQEIPWDSSSDSLFDTDFSDGGMPDLPPPPPVLIKDIKFTEFIAAVKEWNNVNDVAAYLAPFREESTGTLFPLIRLLLPDLDRNRPSFNCGEATLLTMYRAAFKIKGTNNTYLNDLEHWTVPSKSYPNDTGDFARCAAVFLEAVISENGFIASRMELQQNRADRQTLTLETFMQKLIVFGTGRGVSRSDKFLDLILATGVDTHMEVIRIILNLHISKISTPAIFDAIHDRALDRFNETFSLETVCSEFYRQNARYDSNLRIKIGVPFRPMRCKSNQSLQSIFKAMEGKQFIVDTKYDGERTVIHKSKTTYTVFSRNGHDVTEKYRVLLGAIGNYITAEYCILDGEMMMAHHDSLVQKVNRVGAGAATPSAHNKHVFIAYDILVKNNACLVNHPLRSRHKILGETVTPEWSSSSVPIKRSNATIIQEEDELKRRAQEAVKAIEEGLVIKHLDSPYTPNGTNNGWYKWKPMYQPSLIQPLDLVVVGASYGKRDGLQQKMRMQVGYQIIYLAYAASNVSGTTLPGSYTCIGLARNIDNGAYAVIAQFMKDHGEETPPRNVDYGDHRPDIYLPPTLVVEVRATNLISNADSFSLTEAFIKCIRNDKDADAADTLATIQQNAPHGKFIKSHGEIEMTRQPPRIAPPVSKKQKILLPEGDLPLKREDFGCNSTLFNGLTFYLPDHGMDHKSYNECRHLIHQNAGKIVLQIAHLDSTGPFYVVTDKSWQSSAALELTAKGNKKYLTNVVKPSWIRDSVCEKTLSTHHYWHKSALEETTQFTTTTTDEAKHSFHGAPPTLDEIDNSLIETLFARERAKREENTPPPLPVDEQLELDQLRQRLDNPSQTPHTVYANSLRLFFDNGAVEGTYRAFDIARKFKITKAELMASGIPKATSVDTCTHWVLTDEDFCFKLGHYMRFQRQGPNIISISQLAAFVHSDADHISTERPNPLKCMRVYFHKMNNDTKMELSLLATSANIEEVMNYGPGLKWATHFIWDPAISSEKGLMEKYKPRTAAVFKNVTWFKAFVRLYPHALYDCAC